MSAETFKLVLIIIEKLTEEHWCYGKVKSRMLTYKSNYYSSKHPSYYYYYSTECFVNHVNIQKYKI